MSLNPTSSPLNNIKMFAQQQQISVQLNLYFNYTVGWNLNVSSLNKQQYFG
jgi:hypothetical protein